MDNKPDTLFQNFRKRIQGSSRTSKVASVVAFFALVSHIFFLGLFFFLHVTPMFYFNIFSVIFFTVIFLTSKNRSSYIFFYLICSIEVIAHQISAVYFIGADSSFHYFIILMGLLPFLVVEDHNKFSIVCAAVCGAIFVAVHLGFSGHQPPYVIDPLVLKIIKGVNIGSTLIVIDAIVLVFTRAVQQAEKEAYEQYTRAEHLLYNILPDSIAERLKISSKNIAESYDSVSVLFLDIVNFTQFSSHLSAEQLVSILNSLFSKFDVLCDKYILKKSRRSAIHTWPQPVSRTGMMTTASESATLLLICLKLYASLIKNTRPVCRYVSESIQVRLLQASSVLRNLSMTCGA